MNNRTSTTKIGWIGTGVMGRWMCQHLVNKGYPTIVYNRTKEKARPLLDSGAIWVDSPFEAAKTSDVIFTVVGGPSDLQEIILGETGILKSAKPGSIIVDMTTSKPSLAVEIYRKAKEQGVASIDAPISGGDVGAREATLSIMAGGDIEAIQTVMPLFEAIAKNIVHQGGAGTGQHTKMCNQIAAAGTLIGVCEGLLYGYKAGLDMHAMFSSVSKGAASSWSFDNYAPRIFKRDFNPGCMVRHFIKDMELVLDEADKMDLHLPGLSLVYELYLSIQAHGKDELGLQSLILALEKLSLPCKQGEFMKEI